MKKQNTVSLIFVIAISVTILVFCFFSIRSKAPDFNGRSSSGVVWTAE